MSAERQNQTRLFRILDLLKEGVHSSQVLSTIYEQGVKRGLNSERVAQEALSKLEIIKAVRKSSNEEDYFLKVDFFISFKDGLKHTLVGVQVKSSGKALKEFMEKVEPGKRIIGICVRDGVHHEEIQRQFLTQLTQLDGEI